MVLRSLLTASVLTAAGCVFTGCAAQTAPQAATHDLPTFEKPSDIKPADKAYQSKPMPQVATAAPSPTQARVPGMWTPPVAPRNWKFIVIHHSASPSGNAALFDKEHRAKGWDELGYHFVIDNGRGGADGNIEVGPRWIKQKWGAHAKTPDNRYNDFGIGICFVGNFEQGKPTAKQLAAASKLVAWLEQTYNIPEKNVIGHEDTGKQTLCPGKFLSVAKVRTMADQVIAEASGLPSPAVSDAEGATAIAHLAVVPQTRELIQATR